MGLFKAIGGVVGGFAKKAAAKRNQRRYAADRKKATAEMASLEKNRQKVINPYDNFSNLSSMAKDLSGKLSNPYANLSVATGASKMQAEEADIALANTLDTLRETGGGAGSATALAQAALQSKQSVAAGIEQQEKANEDKRAAGEERLQQAKLNEEKRMQGLDAAGKQFVYGQQEGREMMALERLQGQIDNQQGIKAQASADQTAAFTGAISGVAGAVSGGFGKKVS